MKSKILLVTLIIISYVLGCEKEDISPVEYKFQVLNEQGVAQSTFEEGENVIFSFQIKNNTNEDHYLRHYKMELDDFCRLSFL
jgi:hypothetical protein